MLFKIYSNNNATGYTRIHRVLLTRPNCDYICTIAIRNAESHTRYPASLIYIHMRTLMCAGRSLIIIINIGPYASGLL